MVPSAEVGARHGATESLEEILGGKTYMKLQ
jgi:hypothetical protein